MIDTRISRRAGIGLLSGVMAATATSAFAAPPDRARAAQPRQYSFANDGELVRTLMKMKSHKAGEISFAWLRANRYCYVEGEIFPLLSLVAGIISVPDRFIDGAYTNKTAEITFYTDFNTGALLDSLEMPVTGKKVAVPLYRSEPKQILISKESHIREISKGNAGMTPKKGETGSSEPAFAPSGEVALDRSIGPAILAGDALSIRTSEYGRLKPYDKAFTPVFYKESSIWTASLKDILQDDSRFVPATLSYSAADSWRPWMKMGDVPGHTMGDGIGGTVERFEDLPNDFLEFTKAHYPEVIRDPKSALGT